MNERFNNLIAMQRALNENGILDDNLHDLIKADLIREAEYILGMTKKAYRRQLEDDRKARSAARKATPK